jgi:NarL family two-component system response regulator LiaR
MSRWGWEHIRNAGMSSIRVVVVDDFDQVRVALRDLLGSTTSVAVVGEAKNGADAIRVVESTRPDAVVMDVRMPVMDGATATAEIKRRWPEIEVVALSSSRDLSSIAAMLKAGAHGYVLKGGPIEELAASLHAAVAGRDEGSS